jgi:hypothetical protein
MSDFSLWFTTGLQHILDWNGYDHICYVLVLAVSFPPREWKKLFGLITAFTIGHSITLALSVLDILKVPQTIIEILIPLTILITCVYTIVRREQVNKTISLNYFLALFFGFIHGMGFSYLLKSMLGREQSIVSPLFSFNIGLEAGQLVIVAAVILISLFLENVLKVKRSNYVFFISAAVFGIASVLLLERI